MTSEELKAWIERFAAIDRESCSPGEHLAAELIADALRAQDTDARVERHRVHGTYWWPLGLTSAAGLLATAGGPRRRLLRAALGALGGALVVDDLGAGRRWLRRCLPKRETANVVATAGDRTAEETLVVVAHHDAAHTGVFFDPRIAGLLSHRPARGRRRRVRSTRHLRGVLAPMSPIVLGPVLAGVGALAGSRRLTRFARLVCAGIIVSFAEIALSPTVPGANDNLTGVVTLLALARALKDSPVRGLRVILVSTGAEEALMVGMRAFAARHFPGLDPQRTHVLCVDAVGSPDLVLAEEEGMLQVRRYDEAFKQLISQCAEEAGVRLRRGVPMRLGTDGYLALRHGLPAAMLMSLNRHGGASNYHWPTDTPDRVDYRTLADAITLCERVIRRLAAPPAPLRPAPAP